MVVKAYGCLIGLPLGQLTCTQKAVLGHIAQTKNAYFYAGRIYATFNFKPKMA